MAPLVVEAGLLRTEVQVLDDGGAWRSRALVLDLGSSRAVTLLPGDFERMAVASAEQGTLRFSNARGDAMEAKVRVAAGVRFAGTGWAAVPVSEAVWHPDYAPPLALGVIGWPLLARHRVTVDVAAGRIELGPSEPGCAGVGAPRSGV